MVLTVLVSIATRSRYGVDLSLAIPDLRRRGGIFVESRFTTRDVGETGASCLQGQIVTEAFYENIAHMEIPSTVVGSKSTSRHIVQKSAVKKRKLTRCSPNDFLNT